MSDFLPQGGLSQAYTALTRFAGIERNTTREKSSQNFATQVDQSGKSEFNAADETLSAQPRSVTKEDGFKEYFVSTSSTIDPNAPRGSYVNIVV